MTNQQDSLRITSISKALAGEDCLLPSFLCGVAAGFPSPADDYMDKELDLNELVIKHPAATFYVRVEGHSMRDAGIHSGDILVVDRSLSPSSGKIIVAILNGEFTVKRLIIEEHGTIVLRPENSNYPPIQVSPEADFQVWGVVTYVIHQAH